jgi:two-component system, sensor histidine kinase
MPAVAGSTNEPGKDEPIAGPVATLWAQAAHDLRQPVQAALLLTNMLDDVSDRAALRRTARHIGATLQSLQEMLEMLTLLARIEAGLQSMPLRACRIADDLEPALHELAEIAASQGISLRVRRLRGLVKSHPKLLVAVGRSVVLNAIKHGDGQEIRVTSRRSGDHLRLEVRFSGPLPAAGSSKHAFVQLSPRSDRPSVGQLGLGLPLLQHLCRRLGHELQHTTLGGGRQSLVLTLPFLAP